MKKCLFFLLVALLLPTVVYGSMPREVTDALPSEAGDFLRDWQKEGELSDWRTGLSLLPEKIADVLLGDLPRYMQHMTVIVLSVLLCSAIRLFLPADDVQLKRSVGFAGVLAIACCAITQLQSILQTGTRTIESLRIFSQAIIPTLAAAVATSGGIVTAGIQQTITVVVTELLMELISGVLMPLTCCHIFLATASALLPEQKMDTLAAFLRKGITWFLTGCVLLFTGLLKLSSASAISADALTLKMTRSAISSAVPVVGSIISDAAGSVLQSALLLKNTVGVAGMLLVLAICIHPFLTMAIAFALYRLAALLCSFFGEEGFLRYLEALGSSFALVLGMTGCCAVMVLISLASFVSVVIS